MAMLISRMHRIQRRVFDNREIRNSSERNEYIEKLLYNDREQPRIHRNNERPDILKSEFLSAMVRLNRNIATGADGIITVQIELMTLV